MTEQDDSFLNAAVALRPTGPHSNDLYESLSAREQETATRIAVIEERLAGMDRVLRVERHNVETALKLQAAEYERRLDVLNHSHQRADRVQTTYLPREVFDRFETQSMAWRRVVDEFMATSKGKSAMIVAIGGIALSSFTIVLAVINAIRIGHP